MATDPDNVGRQQQWWREARPEAKPCDVPGTIQDQFTGYHGVAWYWRDFDAPASPSIQGRTLLRFQAVDYLAEVWVNDVSVGAHEGGESSFVLDVTDALKPGARNRLAVRVLNPRPDRRIDDLVQPEVPQGNRRIPLSPGSALNYGGIVDSVELLTVPHLYLEDLFAEPDVRTGDVRICARLCNAAKAVVKAQLEWTVAPAATGQALATILSQHDLPVGQTTVDTQVHLDHWRAWDLNDPYLYRVTARLRTSALPSQGSPATRNASEPAVHELSVRCGFRDFRFENGYFRLNGRRVYLKSALTGNDYPFGLPHDPDWVQRDLLNHKAMGFNMIRFIARMPLRRQLELCDEIGLLVYEECYGSWLLNDSSKMVDRYDRATREMILRDRNHTSVVMWGLLNETPDGPVFRHAVTCLPWVRALDASRVVILSSGRFDCLYGGLLTSGLEIWSPASTDVPSVTHNPRKETVRRSDGTSWTPGRLALYPTREGAYSVVRWTAPATATYSIVATFVGMAKNSTTDVHVLHQGTAVFSGEINLDGKRNEQTCSTSLAIKTGETIDFVVGRGKPDHNGDNNTGLTAVIKSSGGQAYDAAADFSVVKNPNGPWSYGCLKPGASPNASSFQLYPSGKDVVPPKMLGSLSNPGSTTWEDVLSDQHLYKRVPHTAAIIREFRAENGGGKPVFLSESGVGSAVNLIRLLRHFEQLGKTASEGAVLVRGNLDRFMADWQRWKLADTWANPEDYFQQCLAKMAGQRALGFNAVRSNPNIIGFSPTQAVDPWTGEGLVTLFRDLKPGTVDAVFDGWYPLRWCLFAEPVNVYRNTPVRLEAVLSNNDVLAAGEYPVRLQVVGPGAKCVLDRTLKVAISDPHTAPEPKMAIPVFAEDVVVDSSPGTYRFLATFEHGAAAAAGETVFYVADPAELPKVETEVVLWGEDAKLKQWLGDHGIRTRPFSSKAATSREVILASSTPPSPGGAPVFRELAQRMAQGATVIFLSPAVFAQGDQSAAWVPLAKKGSLTTLPAWLYHKDEWAKTHPIFEGLPAGGLMDYLFYREVIPDSIWMGQDPPAEVVAGAIDTSMNYSAGLMVSVHRLGAGGFILNTLNIRENLGRNPPADRLLLNMLRYAARNAARP